MRLTKRLLKTILLLFVVHSLVFSFYQPASAANCDFVKDALASDECVGEKTDLSPEQATEEVEDTSPTELNLSGSDNGFMTVLKLIGSLALIIGLLYGLLRFLNNRTKSFQQSKLLENMGGVPLGPNRSVQLIKVGDRVLVVGVGDSIQLLKEIDAEDERQALISLRQEQTEQMDAPVQKAVDWAKAKLHKNSYQAPKNQQDMPISQNQSSFKEVFTEKLQNASNTQNELEKALKERNKDV